MAGDHESAAPAFQKGTKAKEASLGKGDNPYVPLTPEHAEWEAGRTATYDLDEESDPASNRDQPADEPRGGSAVNEP